MRKPEKSKTSCPKNMPITRIYRFFYVAYEEKCWLIKKNSRKNYLSGKKSSVFQARSTGLVLLAWKIEDFLPEKCPGDTRISRFLFCDPWGILKNRRANLSYCPKKCLALGFEDFLCRLWEKVYNYWVPEKNFLIPPHVSIRADHLCPPTRESSPTPMDAWAFGDDQWDAGQTMFHF